jgi:hypothetical protein
MGKMLKRDVQVEVDFRPFQSRDGQGKKQEKMKNDFTPDLFHPNPFIGLL